MQKKVRRINIPSLSSNFLAPQLELPHSLDNDHLLTHSIWLFALHNSSIMISLIALVLYKYTRFLSMNYCMSVGIRSYMFDM